MCEKLACSPDSSDGATSFEGVLSYFYSQVDQLREIAQSEKFKTRDNKELTKQVIQELHRHKPNVPIYRIVDELPFTDEYSVVPSLALKSHLRKLYPNADEGKLQLFLTLADINGDQRIEVQELMQFFTEIEDQRGASAKVTA